VDRAGHVSALVSVPAAHIDEHKIRIRRTQALMDVPTVRFERKQFCKVVERLCWVSRGVSDTAVVMCGLLLLAARASGGAGIVRQWQNANMW
jgi:hypothetical protein